MADMLRAKLKALVESWEIADLHSKACSPGSARVERRRQITALLAESEPVKREGVCLSGLPERFGCGRDHGGGSWNANCPDCEAKAKCRIHPGCNQDCPKNCDCCTRKCEPGCDHCAQQKAKAKPPLGHPYENHHEDQGVSCTLAGLCHYGTGLVKCGQPRSAHEVKPWETR